MRPRKTRPKTVNVALPVELHEKLVETARLFKLSIFETTAIIFRNGLKSSISCQVDRLENKIHILKTLMSS